jgi:hypothetical protein
MSSNIKHTIGTVIEGASDSKLIIEAFLKEIRKHDSELFLSLRSEFNSIENCEDEDGQEFLVNLMEILDSYSSSEYVFTSHPYQPLNYGFWSNSIFN